MMRNVALSILLIFCFSLDSFGQCYPTPSGSKKDANFHYENFNFDCALKEYLLLHTKKPKNVKVNTRIAKCYLSLPGDKSKAEKYLKFVLSQKKYDNEINFDMGMCLHYQRKYDEAVKYFNKYKTDANDEEKKRADRYIGYCKNAKELEKYPLDVTYENLGKNVNSEYQDIHPFIPADESFVAFTTTRKGTVGGMPDINGFTSDVYFTKLKRGKYSKARSIGGMFNSDFAEEIAGGSPNGRVLIYSQFDFQITNLKISVKKGRARSFPKPNNMVGINQKNSNEIAATITNDMSLLIFASDRKGGYGGYDLWMSRALPNGTWGEPINLGPKINTEFNETFPMFSQDGKSIYFASEGHVNMGAFDLFETTFSEDLKTWTTPRNLGYPINSTDNDYSINFTDEKRHAYVSAVRSDSYGMSDIYRVTFNNVVPQYTVVQLQVEGDSVAVPALLEKVNKEISTYQAKKDSLVALSDSTLKPAIARLDSILGVHHAREKMVNPYKGSKFIVKTTSSNAVYGEYHPNPKTGKCVMILKPGNYVVTLDNEAYEKSTFNIKIWDKKFYTPQMSKSIVIKPKADI